MIGAMLCHGRIFPLLLAVLLAGCESGKSVPSHLDGPGPAADLQDNTRKDAGASLKPDGAACSGPGECRSGHCVDGVCCDSACDGTCAACNLGNTTGQCTPHPTGSDPESECAGFSCAGYYAGFASKVCHHAADVEDGAAHCDGAGACETADARCPQQPAGAVQLTCEGDCSVPDQATCSGTTAGVCVTADLGTQTCGTGDCAQEVPRCADLSAVDCEQGFLQLLGPTPYLSQADSPFNGPAMAWFHLEDLEDDEINTPGLSVNQGQLSSNFGASLIDSVDGDDGSVDDTCADCNAWWAAGSMTFTFDPDALGGNLPTHVGAVWTDGAGEVTFEVFGQCGLLGTVGPVSEEGFPDASYTGGVGEDRFFGAVAPGGITQIRVSNSSGGTETDHIQYGRVN
jgi:hypothetical protein